MWQTHTHTHTERDHWDSIQIVCGNVELNIGFIMKWSIESAVLLLLLLCCWLIDSQLCGFFSLFVVSEWMTDYHQIVLFFFSLYNIYGVKNDDFFPKKTIFLHHAIILLIYTLTFEQKKKVKKKLDSKWNFFKNLLTNQFSFIIIINIIIFKQ